MASTTMSDPRELFLHELGDVLFAEQTLVKALPKLKEEASDQELAQRLRLTISRKPASTSRTSSSRSRSWESRPRRRSAPGSRGSRRSTTSSWPTSPPRPRCSTRS